MSGKREIDLAIAHFDWALRRGNRECISLEDMRLAIDVLRTQKDSAKDNLCESTKTCPKCGAIAEYNAYYGRTTCTRCDWESEKQGLNKPLTLEELCGMDGEPVWITSMDGEWPSGWYVLASHSRYGFVPKGRGFLAADDYGKTWLAYRRKPGEMQE